VASVVFRAMALPQRHGSAASVAQQPPSESRLIRDGVNAWQPIDPAVIRRSLRIDQFANRVASKELNQIDGAIASCDPEDVDR